MSPVQAAAFRFVDGGEGTVLSLLGNAIKLRSSVPSPPGSRREAVLMGADLIFKIKVHASRKQEDAFYMIEGRLYDATTRVINALTKATAETAAP